MTDFKSCFGAGNSTKFLSLFPDPVYATVHTHVPVADLDDSALLILKPSFPLHMILSELHPSIHL